MIHNNCDSAFWKRNRHLWNRNNTEKELLSLVVSLSVYIWYYWRCQSDGKSFWQLTSSIKINDNETLNFFFCTKNSVFFKFLACAKPWFILRWWLIDFIISVATSKKRFFCVCVWVCVCVFYTYTYLTDTHTLCGSQKCGCLITCYLRQHWLKTNLSVWICSYKS